MLSLFKKKSGFDEDELLKELGLLEHIDDVSGEKKSNGNEKFNYMLDNVVEKATRHHHVFAIVGYALLGICLIFGAGGNILLRASIDTAQATASQLKEQETDLTQKIQETKIELTEYKKVFNKKHVDAIKEDRILVAEFFLDIEKHINTLKKNDIKVMMTEYIYNQADRSVILKGTTDTFDHLSKIVEIIEDKTDHFTDIEFSGASLQDFEDEQIIPIHLKFYIRSTSLMHSGQQSNRETSEIEKVAEVE